MATAGPAAASSSGNGVHVDPGSPAGKQYAIPIPTARNETSGQQGGGNASNPPLFGVGVTPGGAAATAGGSSARAASTTNAHAAHLRRHVTRANAHRRSGGQAGQTTGTPGGKGTTRNAADTSSPGGTSWLPLLIGGALVLLIGGGGGFFLRRSL